MVTTNISSDAFELGYLQYIFQKADPWGMVIEDGPTQLKLCLFTADPRDQVGAVMPAIGGVGSLEPTSAQYQSYARLGVNRSAAEWTCATAAGVSSATKATNDAVFATAGGASSGCVATWVGVAMAVSAFNGAGGDCLLLASQLDTPLTISAGIAPRMNVGDLVFKEE